ncbi:hypothetical protein [Geothrix sp. 21YS21S-2]|uniref:hypothetical protein n=1 Tax=Geothrix sp. 21YS21S-2 TaxID=3068893 RepID=UPI0027BA6A94|nr:hypothetical protein [Geothrix sp. 21YS21S-2]
MRYLPSFAPALVLTLSAQDLPVRLQGAQRLPADAIRALQGELAASGQDRPYWDACLAYALVSQLGAKEPKAMEALLDRTLKALEPRRDAESLALAGACLGLKLGFKPMLGMTLSPQASGLFTQALKAAPGNPRALLFQGIHALHTPAFAGGGPEKALPILEAAARAADGEQAPADPWAPCWGRAESRAWLALALHKAGRAGEARANLDKALALDPAYGFARFVVLPQVGAK